MEADDLGGRSVAVARLVMLMLLVFDAKIASASARARERLPRLALDRFVLEDRLDDDVVAGGAIVPSAVPMRPRISSATGCSSLPFSTWRARLAAIRAVPFSASSEVRSERVTDLPAAAPDLCDPVAHQACADDEDAVDAHGARRVPAALTKFSARSP
jgi:hypothetical protein